MSLIRGANTKAKIPLGVDKIQLNQMGPEILVVIQ